MPDARTPITVDDLYRLDWLEDPRCSPDGRWVAFVRVAVDRVGNCYRRSIWLAPTDGGAPRRFTAGPADSAPRWSPDGGWLAFVARRGDAEAAQLYVIRADGGEARAITSLPGGASEPAWAPDSARIAFLSAVNAAERATEDGGEQPPAPDSAWAAEQAAARRRHDEAERFDPRVLTRMPYRAGTSFFDDRRNHVYVVDLPADDEAARPAPRRLTDGDMHYGAPAWMPDGESILSTATRDPEADAIFAFYDVLRIPVLDSGRAEPVRLTTAGFSYYDPEPALDGRLIALRRRSDARPLADGARVALLDADGGDLRDLTAHADLSVERFRWQPDGRAILFTASWRGDQPIYRVAVEPGSSQQSAVGSQRSEAAKAPAHPLTLSPFGSIDGTASRFVEAFDVAPDGGVAFVAGDGGNPCELFFRDAGGRELQLTRINTALLAERYVAPFEELTYHAPDGQAVQSWVLRPPDFDPARRYPLVVHIHGGPHYMWGPGFRTMWHELQATAARGYLVFFCNPRGSEGYGEAWRDAIHANWGFADAPDILAGVDALVERGAADPARIGVTGGSYGGYMAAWLIAHTDRFACAVTARGVYNLQTHHGTSDAHELIEYEFDGYPWEMYEKLWRHSPLAYAHQISTPLRILHAENDYRVPIGEAEQLFAILRRRRQTVELVRYPREGHELTRVGEPRHRADHIARTLEWLDRYCRP